MSSYSAELNAQIVKKMMPPNKQSVAQISRENDIHVTTLYTWKKQFQAKGFVVPAKKSPPDQWDQGQLVLHSDNGIVAFSLLPR